MPLTTRFRLLHAACSLIGSLFACSAPAFGTADPFDTRLLVPPEPRLSLQEDPDFTPCTPHTATLSYGVVEVVDRALCNNPKTREFWAGARVQAAQVGIAQSDFLPDLNGNIGITRRSTDGETSRQRSAALTLYWLLYDFGARAANLENARQLLSAATATLDSTVQGIFLSALQAYYNAQASRAAVTALLESEKASRESFAAAETRYRVGTGTPADRLQAQTALSQATLNRIRAEGLARSALGTLASVMGLDAGQPLKLDTLAAAEPGVDFEQDVSALIEEARRNRPDLKAAEAQVNAARSSIDFARASGRPTIALSALPAWQDNRTDSLGTSTHSNAIGLTLTVPIFSGFDTTYRVRAAEARADVAGAQRESLRLQVALDVWTAYQSLQTATQTIRTSIDLLASAEQSERVALGRYKAGVGTLLDLLNAQSALASARLQRIQSGLDWHVSRATLAKAVGLLDGRLLNPAARANTP